MAGRSNSEQLFRVVYDPVCDCFVLQDAECGGEQRSRTMMTQADAGVVPWDQWVLPPRSASKDRSHQQHQKYHRPCFVSKPAELLTTCTTKNDRGEGRPLSDAMAELTLDLQAEDEQQSTELATDAPTSPLAALPLLDLSTLHTVAAPTAKGPILKPTTPSVRKARVRDYNAHFARANAQLRHEDVALLKQDHTTNRVPIEPTWNGEPVHVKVACVRHLDTRLGSDDTHTKAERATSASNQRIYDFALLARIRSSGDGFRDADVNRGCSFTPLTSSSSSSEEDEAGRSSSSSLSSLSDASSLCVFERGDCVLFRAKRRRFRGVVVRRVRDSSFYYVRAANGTLFRAVAATHIRLLPLDDHNVCEPPLLPLSFQRGDRVLWLPTTTQSYKARVVRLRSLDRYDIELRSGRVHRKVSIEELQPAL